MEKIMICGDEDLDKLQTFIDEKWRKGHVLALSNVLMDFQHKSSAGYNFVIAKNSDDAITAILGFIPTYKYDKGLEHTINIWLAIWKVDEEIAAPGTGFALLKWLQKEFKPESIGSIGINNSVKRIYDILGYTTGILNQYYIRNPSVAEYRIADFAKDGLNIESRGTLSSRAKEIEFSEIGNLNLVEHPMKSAAFIKHRYLDHPVYNYLLLGVYTDNVIEAVVVVRKVDVGQNSCLRIVDIQGNYSKIGSIQESLVELMAKYDCEYIDCLNHGISEQTFNNWGFKLKNATSVIPEYFDPFVRENIDIMFAYKSTKEKYLIFKGDSDQDRPNTTLLDK